MMMTRVYFILFNDYFYGLRADGAAPMANILARSRDIASHAFAYRYDFVDAAMIAAAAPRRLLIFPAISRRRHRCR